MKKIKSNGLFLLILFIVTRNGLYSIDLNSFCKTDQLKCTGNYDSGFKYEILCENTKCHGKFGFECLNQICSKSKKGCLNLKYNRLWSIWTPYTIKLNQKSEKTTININYNSITFNEELSFPYSVPNSYERIFIN
jgi:hypothetical protein